MAKRTYTKGMQIVDRLAVYSRPQPNGCWEWSGGKNASGYGVFCINSKPIPAHRASWEAHYNKPIPKGKWVLHACDNPACINPNHLFLGTHQDNVTDKVMKGRQSRGETLGKLSESDVLTIRNSSEPQRALAERYGVSVQNISKVQRREIWTHIP